MAKAKKPSLLEAAKSLPHCRSGGKIWQDRLTPEQLQQFDELCRWFKNTPADERPTFASLKDLLAKEFGRAPSEQTFRKCVNAK